MKNVCRSCITSSLFTLGIALVTEQKNVGKQHEREADSFSTSAIQELFDTVKLEFDAFEADADRGPDAGLSLVLVTGGGTATAQAGSSDPVSSLKDYCAGKTASSSAKMKEGARVMADWEDYGQMYPGRIVTKNPDGTFKIKYDDGFTEDGVTPANMKAMKEEEERKRSSSSAANDPACKFLELVDKVKPKIQNLLDALAMWCMNARAKIAGDKGKLLPAPPKNLRKQVEALDGQKPALVPAGLAPAPAAVPEEYADEIAALKTEFAENDEYIEELKVQEAEQAKLLEEYTLDAASSVKENINSGVKTVENLIAEYKNAIADQQTEIAQRTKRIGQQAMELARLGAKAIPLEKLLVDATALEDEVTGAWEKMTLMDEEGELDPDLKHILEGVMMPIRNVRGKISNLMNQEKKTMAKLDYKKDEAKKAADESYKKAKDAAKAIESEVEKEEMQMLQSAQGMTNSFRKSRNEVQVLDVGLHPQGAKWWRYRYEHAYIEAWIMICVSILMLLWRKFVMELKIQLEIWALPAGQGATDLTTSASTAFYDAPGRDDGSLFTVWLTCLAEMMLCCILVFITIWIICKTWLIDLMPFAIKTGDMNAPVSGDQYRKLAIDCASIYFFAILMYFILIFPVAHDTKRLTHKIAKQFEDEVEETDPQDFAAAVSMGVLARSKTEFQKEQFFFRDFMSIALAQRTEKEAVQLREMFGDDWSTFPLTTYLIMSVHMNISNIFEFLWKVWLPFVISFVLFAGLHRFWHMGYVRIMAFFTCVTFLLILAIGWYTKSIGQAIDGSPDEFHKTNASAVHRKWQTETVVLKTLQFVLFFQCYGVSRMICHPWMWELHFWPVLTLTILAVVCALLFGFFVAPALPSFCAVMAMPPYLNHQNMRVMIYAAEVDAKEKAEFNKEAAKYASEPRGTR